MKGFNLKYLFVGSGTEDWWKALGSLIRIIAMVSLAVLLVLGALNVWNFFFPKPSQNIHRPSTIVLPGAKVDKIDQSSIQVMVEEKTWELGVGAGGITYDGKSGLFLGGWIKKKW
ncbi:MAG: hypothetical protein WC444_07165 [Candidatus Paceibacterota bacterium]